ncbi:MAG: CapA family protein [Chloroflexota bacterium]
MSLALLSLLLSRAGRDAELPAAPPDLSVYPWLYLREGTPPAAGEGATLLAVGDVMLGRDVLAEPDPLADVSAWLATADLVLGNFEGVIADVAIADASPTPPGYDLRMPPAAAAHLRAAGFDVVGLANNHSLDLGAAGLEHSAAHLTTAGLAVIGAGPDRRTAVQPGLHMVNGVQLALLAFNAVPDPVGQDSILPNPHDWTRADWDTEMATAAVADARAQADAVIVSIHWGYEYQRHADPAQRRLAEALFAAGADLIVGHHPHVVQETAVQSGRFVAYSLGNFVFDQGQGETGQGLALRAVFDAEGLLAVQALPVWAGPRPGLVALETAEMLLSRIRLPAPRIGFVCSRPADLVCRPTDVPQAPQTGPFWSGEIDLTGDGVPELVRQEGEQIIIYSEGTEVWRGLPEWRVVDLALGDANDDGRMEAILALWKEDEAGIRRSHPFIIGHRGGRYTLLWGGSAVALPIHELQLGDVTGEGVDNLVVLEETAAGHRDGQQRTISVWRWHGWGYTLLWRSPPGHYRDLVLLSGRDGQPAVISVAVHFGE